MPQIIISETYIEVSREECDPKFYGVKNARGESNFLYWLKEILNTKYGFDLIKKRMHKDGHLVDDTQQYLRTRSPKSPKPHLAIWNGHWAFHGAEEDFNNGKVTLRVERDIYDEALG